jgi:hypothetical protein
MILPLNTFHNHLNVSFFNAKPPSLRVFSSVCLKRAFNMPLKTLALLLVAAASH